MIGCMATEIDELLALHNRVLRQCWDTYRHIENPADLQAHSRALQAAGLQLQQLFQRYADKMPAESRREAVRTMARMECFLKMYLRQSAA
jgi:hypothetical protein